jgi:small conductance mechanosensitive channel
VQSVAFLLTSTVDDTCGTDGGTICEWVYDQTGGNEQAAVILDWVVGKPLAILGVVLTAFVVRFVARRLVKRAVRRMMVPPDAVLKHLDALGMASTDEADVTRRLARANSIGAAMASTISAIIVTTAVVTIASILGFELGPIIAGAGVLGVAIGFGAQSLVRDAINGVFMLIEDQYGIGDTVDLGAANGVVERISLRTTVLRGADGTVWHVPNGQVNRVGNRSQRWSVAVLDVLVAYSTDIAKATAEIHRAADAVAADPEFASDVLEPPQVLGMESVTANGVALRLSVKTTAGRQGVLERALREAIKEAFDAAGIERPHPQPAE